MVKLKTLLSAMLILLMASSLQMTVLNTDACARGYDDDYYRHSRRSYEYHRRHYDYPHHRGYYDHPRRHHYDAYRRGYYPPPPPTVIIRPPVW